MTTSFSQISKKRRDVMDALTEDELIFEIKKGRGSRFSRSLHYLEYRLHKINNEKQGIARDEDIEMAREANYLSKEANQHSADANNLSKWAIGISILAIIMSLIAIGMDMKKADFGSNNAKVINKP